MLLPFSNAVVPEVDIAGGRVVIALPQEIEGEDGGSDLSARRPRLVRKAHGGGDP